jgi:aromatic ring hydroxylase
VASGRNHLPSNATDFDSLAVRSILDHLARSSKGYATIDRARPLKLLWGV